VLLDLEEHREGGAVDLVDDVKAALALEGVQGVERGRPEQLSLPLVSTDGEAS
jgi:hypothetical protein